MTQTANLSDAVDDHSLEAVPDSQRQSWLQLSWSTVGIVTTLVQLFVGALVTFVAGIQIGLLAGLLVTVIGAGLGWGVGHVAFRSGLSSTVLSRYYGFGEKGSMLTAAVFGFMIIGFLALENALLYKGFLFYLNLSDTLAHRVVIYGALTLAWILLTAFGFALVARVASITVVAFLAVLVYMVFDVIATSGHSWASVVQFGSQLPPEMLKAMGADTPLGKFSFCVNVLIGSAGALALIDADLGRYARSSAGIGIAALLGNLFMDVIMLVIGGIVMYAGMDALVAYHVKIGGLTQQAAQALAMQSPDSVAAAFIVFGGLLGTVLMVLAQSKAQVLNTYSASLSLTNFIDATLGWRPGRLVFVVLANLISLTMLWGSILSWFNSFITILGVLTTCFAAIIMADFFIVRPRLGQTDIARHGAQYVNWAGIVTTAIGFALAHYVLTAWIPIEFFTSLVVSFVLYPVLRLATVRRASAAPATIRLG